MFDKKQYELITNKYGQYASWAIWAEAGVKPKSNIGDLRVFNAKYNPDLMKQLKPNIVMVGLNISRKIEKTYANFHDYRSHAMDYKIRFAFKDTPFYGAYMTDIVKDFEQKISGKVTSYLKQNKAFKIQNIKLFREEMKALRVKNTLIIAFGNDALNILLRNFSNEYNIIKIPHYSNRICKEKYRKEVNNILSKI